MRRLLPVVITALCPVACLPPPEDAGQVDPTESDDAGGETMSTGEGDESSGTSGAPPPEADIEATVELEPDLFIVRMMRTQDGVLVALMGDPVEGYYEVREYSTSLELLWSLPMPGATITDLEDLGGGEVLAVGSSDTPGGWSPTAWRISCCSAPVSQQYPQDIDESSIIGAELRGDGLLYAIQGAGRSTVLVEVPMALAPTTEVELLDDVVYDAVRTPAGTVLLRVDAGDGDLFYEVETDGIHGGTGYGGYGGLTIMVGKGDDLTFMTFGEEEVAIMPYGGDGSTWVEIPIPGFVADYDAFTADRYERLVVVHGESDGDEASPLVLTEFADDGTTARALSIPPVQYDRVSPMLVAVGEDQAIYLATSENDAGVPGRGYLHRIAPL